MARAKLEMLDLPEDFVDFLAKRRKLRVEFPELMKLYGEWKHRKEG